MDSKKINQEYIVDILAVYTIGAKLAEAEEKIATALAYVEKCGEYLGREEYKKLEEMCDNLDSMCTILEKKFDDKVKVIPE